MSMTCDGPPNAMAAAIVASDEDDDDVLAVDGTLCMDSIDPVFVEVEDNCI